MNMYGFDHVIDRRGTNALKYDFASKYGKPEDALPLWIADMDFQTAPEIIDAVVKTGRHGIFGYSDSPQAYFDVLQNWYAAYFGWSVQKEWLVKTPGVVFALCTAIRALTEPGDAVIIQRPVYHPFSQSVVKNGRKLVNNPLVYRDGAYTIDFEDFEEKIVRNRVKLFLLCSPHNPVGRVWTKEELSRLGDICVRHDVLVVSDEIHADFVFEGYTHHVFADLKPAYQAITVTCTAPSKSFNLAGLQVSNIWIPNPAIREKFQEELGRTGYSQLNMAGLAAAQAAYEKGRPWFEELKRYLSANLAFTRGYLAEKLPRVRLVEPQGTYLLWLDFSGLGLSGTRLEHFIVEQAKLWLDEGTRFGSEGQGFERMNIACPRSTLQQALERLAQAAGSELV